MRAVMLVLTLTTVCLTFCQADISIPDFIYWKKSDINSWHTYFPSRGLQEELLTNKAAIAAVNSLPSGLFVYLSKIVAFQYRELETAKQLMGGTDAEGCINGISNFLNQSISDLLDTYDDCTADATSKLNRFNNSLSRINGTYMTAYQRAQYGIDACAKTYPNKDSIDRLISCVESMNKNYFNAATSTMNAIYPSPSMTYFQQTVVTCASNAAQAVAAKGSQFLKMLVNCAALSGTVDPTAYAEELSQWKGYKDTLADQIAQSQTNNHIQVSSVEKDIVNYFTLRKQALDAYVIQSRGIDFYLNKIYSYLSDYYNTVTATSLDNPGDTECITAAKTELDSIAKSGAESSLKCDQTIVTDTTLRIDEINNNLLEVNNIMPSIGNVAVLDCFSQGYIFAPSTIYDCFKLNHSTFNVDYEDLQKSNMEDVTVLYNYASTFYEKADLPCGGTSLERLKLGGETALYNLKRCLYKSSGTNYEVTTPTPYYRTTVIPS